jgi:hypothetical protein
MPSVVTLLFAAFFAHDASTADVVRDEGMDIPDASAFCADVEPFTQFTIADGEELIEDMEMGCTESDGNEPLDVDAELDAV